MCMYNIYTDLSQFYYLNEFCLEKAKLVILGMGTEYYRTWRD